MTRPVFISHSSLDKATADQVCTFLEDQGIVCWIAPRNVPPGATLLGPNRQQLGAEIGLNATGEALRLTLEETGTHIILVMELNHDHLLTYTIGLNCLFARLWSRSRDNLSRIYETLY
jgi:hypothetical protein